jgi:peptide/nickel transport system permease protein
MSLRRVAFAVPLLAAVSAALFALAAFSPFDPLAAYLGPRYLTTSDVELARLAAALGVDQPWWRQWAAWAANLLSGDLGISRTYNQPVAEVVAQRAPWTLLLTGMGLALAVAVSFPTGLLAGARPGSALDRLVAPVATVVQALPPFTLGLGAVAVFAVALRWLPTAGIAAPGAEPTFGQIAAHLVLPTVVVALSQLPWLLLAVRESARAAAASDAVRAAVARGLPRRVVLVRHIAPVSALPFVTVVGLRLPELIVGAALVEEIFAWPGVAGALVDSAKSLDFPLLLALTLGATIAVLAASLLADIAAAALDPRITPDG